jgi:hypothetical protein
MNNMNHPPYGNPGSNIPPQQQPQPQQHSYNQPPTPRAPQHNMVMNHAATGPTAELYLAQAAAAAAASQQQQQWLEQQQRAQPPQPPPPPTNTRKEIYTYTAPWTVFSMAWSRRYVLEADESCRPVRSPLTCIVIFRFGSTVSSPRRNFDWPLVVTWSNTRTSCILSRNDQ